MSFSPAAAIDNARSSVTYDDNGGGNTIGSSDRGVLFKNYVDGSPVVSFMDQSNNVIATFDSEEAGRQFLDSGQTYANYTPPAAIPQPSNLSSKGQRLLDDLNRGRVDIYGLETDPNKIISRGGRYRGLSKSDAEKVAKIYIRENLTSEELQGYDQGRTDPLLTPGSSLYNAERVAASYSPEILKANDPSGYATLYPDAAAPGPSGPPPLAEVGSGTSGPSQTQYVAEEMGSAPMADSYDPNRSDEATAKMVEGQNKEEPEPFGAPESTDFDLSSVDNAQIPGLKGSVRKMANGNFSYSTYDNASDTWAGNGRTTSRAVSPEEMAGIIGVSVDALTGAPTTPAWSPTSAATVDPVSSGGIGDAQTDFDNLTPAELERQMNEEQAGHKREQELTNKIAAKFDPETAAKGHQDFLDADTSPVADHLLSQKMDEQQTTTTSPADQGVGGADTLLDGLTTQADEPVYNGWAGTSDEAQGNLNQGVGGADTPFDQPFDSTNPRSGSEPVFYSMVSGQSGEIFGPVPANEVPRSGTNIRATRQETQSLVDASGIAKPDREQEPVGAEDIFEGTSPDQPNYSALSLSPTFTNPDGTIVFEGKNGIKEIAPDLATAQQQAVEKLENNLAADIERYNSGYLAGGDKEQMFNSSRSSNALYEAVMGKSYEGISTAIKNFNAGMPGGVEPELGFPAGTTLDELGSEDPIIYPDDPSLADTTRPVETVDDTFVSDPQGGVDPVNFPVIDFEGKPTTITPSTGTGMDFSKQQGGMGGPLPKGYYSGPADGVYKYGEGPYAAETQKFLDSNPDYLPGALQQPTAAPITPDPNPIPDPVDDIFDPVDDPVVEPVDDPVVEPVDDPVPDPIFGRDLDAVAPDSGEGGGIMDGLPPAEEAPDPIAVGEEGNPGITSFGNMSANDLQRQLNRGNIAPDNVADAQARINRLNNDQFVTRDTNAGRIDADPTVTNDRYDPRLSADDFGSGINDIRERQQRAVREGQYINRVGGPIQPMSDRDAYINQQTAPVFYENNEGYQAGRQAAGGRYDENSSVYQPNPSNNLSGGLGAANPEGMGGATDSSFQFPMQNSGNSASEQAVRNGAMERLSGQSMATQEPTPYAQNSGYGMTMDRHGTQSQIPQPAYGMDSTFNNVPNIQPVSPAYSGFDTGGYTSYNTPAVQSPYAAKSPYGG